MTNAIRDKQIEPQAGALITAATFCFAIGIATSAGYLDNVGGLQTTLSPSAPVLGGLGWLVAAIGLHSPGEAGSREVAAVNEFSLPAFVAIGYAALRRNDRDLRGRQNDTPAE